MSKKRTPTTPRRGFRSGPDDAVLFVRGISREAKNKFKAWCDMNNVTMSSVTEKIMDEIASNPGFITPRMLREIQANQVA